MDLNLVHLKYLSTAIKLSSFTEAAGQLHVSARGVSKAVKQIERAFGVPLFTRSGNMIAPTEFAQALEPRIEAILAQVDELVVFAETLRGASDSGKQLFVGVANSPLRCQLFSPEDLGALAHAHPSRRMRIRLMGNELCASALKMGLADAAIVFGSIDRADIECRAIGDLRIYAAVSHDHPLAQRRRLSLGDFDDRLMATPVDERLALPLLASVCRRCGIRPRFMKIGTDPASAKHFIRHGGLVLVAGTTLRRAQAEGATAIPLDDDRFTIPLNLAYARKEGGQMAPLLAQLARWKDLDQRGAFRQASPLKNSSGDTSSPSRILKNDPMRISS